MPRLTLTGIDQVRGTRSSEIIKQARDLSEEWRGQEGVQRLGILASFTADFLGPYITVASQFGIPTVPWFGPFGQFDQQLLDPDSATLEQKPDILWLSLRLEDLDPELVFEYSTLLPQQRHDRIQRAFSRIEEVVQAAQTHHRGEILVNNLAVPPVMRGGLLNGGDPESLSVLVAEANRQLATRFQENVLVHVLDYAGWLRKGGDFTDSKLWYHARLPFSQRGQVDLAIEIARWVSALRRSPAKCIVVDLDNTLWGGVLGEDGSDNIALGNDYPGSVYRDFQHYLLALSARGFLLAIASKNDHQDALDVLNSHPEMVLREKHFAAIRVNWSPKSRNLREIAAELNIGIDSLVFVDDSPAERGAMKAEAPEVTVIDLPEEPMKYIDALENAWCLDRVRLLDEDKNRTEMYHAEKRRQRARANRSVEDFLKDLRMVATVSLASEKEEQRVSELIHKTNQFNMTTRRHEREVVHRLRCDADSSVAVLRLSDNYGDTGLVCVGILRKRDAMIVEIDTFLMSCRVMGRQVETAFLSYLLDQAKALGGQRVEACYRPTPKNHMVADFYLNHGFRLVEERDNERFYALDLAESQIQWPSVIEKRGV